MKASLIELSETAKKSKSKKKTLWPNKSRCLSLNHARETLPEIYRTTILKTKSMIIFIAVIIIIMIINIVQQS